MSGFCGLSAASLAAAFFPGLPKYSQLPLQYGDTVNIGCERRLQCAAHPQSSNKHPGISFIVQEIAGRLRKQHLGLAGPGVHQHTAVNGLPRFGHLSQASPLSGYFFISTPLTGQHTRQQNNGSAFLLSPAPEIRQCLSLEHPRQKSADHQ